MLDKQYFFLISYLRLQLFFNPVFLITKTNFKSLTTLKKMLLKYTDTKNN